MSRKKVTKNASKLIERLCEEIFEKILNSYGRLFLTQNIEE
jgi:dihydroneopterin aldolase